MKTVYLDTNILIYLSQPHSDFFIVSSQVLELAVKENYRIITSSFGFAEYATLRDAGSLETEVDELFTAGQIIELPFGHPEAELFASLRLKHGKKLHPIDAVHIATAGVANADYFVTNDKVLTNLVDTKVTIITPSIFVGSV